MEYTERLDLQWDDFEAHSRVTLKKLRGESEFCDVTLACNGKQVSAHKVILAGGSSFFQQILRQNPHPHPLVYLKGVRYEDLLTILDFVYTGEATIAQEELNSFLEVADDLQIKGLIEKGASSETFNKEGQTTLTNTSYQDTRSVVKEDIGLQPKVSLRQRKTSSHVSNGASQSPYQENQDDTPLGNIKINLTDTVHSNVPYGMNNGEEVMDLKTENLITEEKEMTTYRHDKIEELCREGTTNSMESQNSNGLGFSSAVTSPSYISTHRQQFDSLIQSSKFSDHHNSNTRIKSDDKDNHYQNQMPVDLNIKFEKDDTTNFNFERGDFMTEFNDSCNMTETEQAGSVSKNDVVAHYWYEEGGDYTSATEPAGIVSKNEEVAKAISMEANPNDKVLAMNKNGNKVCSICGKSCRKDFDLKQHMRMHTGERPFVCLYCPQKFTLSCNLKAHTRLHTGEKPYQCMVCNKRFTQLNHLKYHKKCL